jgi:predicted transcriptional regulator
MAEDPELRRALWFLLGGKRGGENRARIIWSLRSKPSNMNQLATELGLQYKSIQHHMKVLAGSSLVAPSGEGYGAVFILTPWFEAHFETFEQICSKLGFVPQANAERGDLGPAVRNKHQMRAHRSAER